jgi:midasin
MLMIDDSSSMREAGALALSALATIAGALGKLEVGDVCVASFAEEVKILHPFGTDCTEAHS